jgi:hypothetical protein
VCVASRWPVADVREVDLHLTPRTDDYSCGTLVAEIAAPPPFARVLLVNHGPSWACGQATTSQWWPISWPGGRHELREPNRRMRTRARTTSAATRPIAADRPKGPDARFIAERYTEGKPGSPQFGFARRPTIRPAHAKSWVQIILPPASQTTTSPGQ